VFRRRAAHNFAPFRHQCLARGILPNHLNQVSSYSTPYNHLVLSRARNYSGAASHSLAEEEKSSGKIRDSWMLRLVGLRDPARRYSGTATHSYTVQKKSSGKRAYT
jgi:hypothetical protein